MRGLTPVHSEKGRFGPCLMMEFDGWLEYIKCDYRTHRRTSQVQPTGAVFWCAPRVWARARPATKASLLYPPAHSRARFELQLELGLAARARVKR